MTLKELEYFVSVARHQSYTKAAKECFITQPALSRAIAGLEAELGCTLFERTTKQVELTPEGKLCLQDAREILDKCQLLRIHAQGEAEQKYRLRLGYMHIGYLSYVSNILNGRNRQFQVDTEYSSFSQLRQKLMSGQLDIMLVPKVNCDGVPGLRYVYLERSPLCVLVHESHPLAGLQAVPFPAIEKEFFIAWDENEVPGANQAHCMTFQQHGFTPSYVATGKKLGDVLMLMQRFDALALTSQSIAGTLPKDFRVVPLENCEDSFGLVCAWREDDRSPAIARLETRLRGGSTVDIYN